MKPIFWIIVSILLSPVLTFAVFAGSGSEVVEPTVDEWVQFLLSLKGWAGFSTLGIAAAVVQGAIFIFRSQFMPMSGKQKIVLVQALSIVAGVIGLRIQDFDWFSALIHANTLGAFQVFLHQLYKQFTDNGDKYEIPKN